MGLRRKIYTRVLNPINDNSQLVVSSSSYRPDSQFCDPQSVSQDQSFAASVEFCVAVTASEFELFAFRVSVFLGGPAALVFGTRFG